jgi:hypothetical protein
VTARDALAQIRERADRATPAPWKIWGMSVAADPVGNSNVDDCIDVAHTVMLDEHGKPRTFDAQFIAHARTDVPALVGALEAVLAIHQPEWTGPDVLHSSGYYRCSADHWTLDDQTPSCPTVAAIETALEGR